MRDVHGRPARARGGRKSLSTSTFFRDERSCRTAGSFGRSRPRLALSCARTAGRAARGDGARPRRGRRRGGEAAAAGDRVAPARARVAHAAARARRAAGPDLGRHEGRQAIRPERRGNAGSFVVQRDDRHRPLRHPRRGRRRDRCRLGRRQVGEPAGEGDRRASTRRSASAATSSRCWPRPGAAPAPATAQAGKNGFKLSLRGYDAEYDYNVLVTDLQGRRFDRVRPERRSLMLLKPTGAPSRTRD